MAPISTVHQASDAVNRHGNRGTVDPRLTEIRTPLKLKATDTQISLNGIEEGFQIRVDENISFRSSKRNMQSAVEYPDITEAWGGFSGEHTGPIFAGDSPNSTHQLLQCDSQETPTLKVEEYNGCLLSWRGSINEVILSEICTLSYITVKEVARVAMALGEGALIAKIDIKSAYRLIPACSQDHKWLSMRWNGLVYIDGMLLFGLSQFSGGRNWMDCGTGGGGAYLSLSRWLRRLWTTRLCRTPASTRYPEKVMRVPLAPEKQFGPSAVIVHHRHPETGTPAPRR